MMQRWGLIGVASTVLFVVAAQQAGATQVGNGSCDSGNFCVYQNSSFGGSVADFSNGTTDGNYGDNEYFNTSTVINDRTSSTWNRSSYAVHLYDGSSWGGNQHKCYDLGESTASYGDFDNSASSHLAATGTCGAIDP